MSTGRTTHCYYSTFTDTIVLHMGKDKNSKFKVCFLLNTHRFPMVKPKNHKSNHCKLRTTCIFILLDDIKNLSVGRVFLSCGVLLIQTKHFNLHISVIIECIL